MLTNFMLTGKSLVKFISIQAKDRLFIKDSLKKIAITHSALNFLRISSPT